MPAGKPLGSKSHREKVYDHDDDHEHDHDHSKKDHNHTHTKQCTTNSKHMTKVLQHCKDDPLQTKFKRPALS